MLLYIVLGFYAYGNIQFQSHYNDYCLGTEAEMLVVLTSRLIILNSRDITIKSIDRLSYWAWCCITSFIDHAIHIFVLQKDRQINGR